MLGVLEIGSILLVYVIGIGITYGAIKNNDSISEDYRIPFCIFWLATVSISIALKMGMGLGTLFTPKKEIPKQPTHPTMTEREEKFVKSEPVSEKKPFIKIVP
jgi:hypothetical protein